MNHYFNEIEAELRIISGDSPIEKQAKEMSDTLFRICQEYLWYNTVNKEIKNAKRILQNYLAEGNYLSYSEKENAKKQKSRKRRQSLDITSKLYIEFFWEAYKQKALEEKDFFKDGEKKFLKIIEKEFFEGIEINFDGIFEKTFEDSNNRDLKENIEMSINMLKDEYEYVIYLKRLENLNLDNLHRAMKIFEDGLKLPKNSLADSVEEILTPEILSYMFNFLKNKDYPNYVFTVAPIYHALWSGEPKSYVGKFFNKHYEYNRKQLKEYFEYLQKLYDEYTEIRSTIQHYKEIIKQPC